MLFDDDSFHLINLATKKRKVYKQPKGLLHKAIYAVCDLAKVVVIFRDKLLIFTKDEGYKTYTEIPSKAHSSVAYVKSAELIEQSSKLVIICPSLIVVWDLNQNKLIASCASTKELSTNETFLLGGYRHGLVLGTTVDTTKIWRLNDSGDGLVNPKPTPIDHDNHILITAFYIDFHVLITGDNRGYLTLRNRETGLPIYNLNLTKKTKSHLHVQVTNIELSNRIRDIKRVGRWVIVMAESSRIFAYDIFQKDQKEPYLELSYGRSDKSKPHAFYVSPAGILQAATERTKKGEESGKGGYKAKPEIWLWRLPRLDGFEYFSSYPDMNKNAAGVLLQLASHTQNILQSVDAGDEDIRDFEQPIDRAVKSLQQVQDLQNFPW
eukprot:CAMPEP_0168531396 /NCGR_PEP_ID=MMETSP0405-20121227/15430_1 /TAXON_ID=498012 /ORGANISM="Trichosphaerium sp, Strain Am-I-7 wt" /LENGTH=378 /DNA_ID=CAMNT_0008556205 /DNA_START=263 /DNA_END=1396 /DNA_ORIENTATION=-